MFLFRRSPDFVTITESCFSPGACPKIGRMHNFSPAGMRACVMSFPHCKLSGHTVSKREACLVSRKHRTIIIQATFNRHRLLYYNASLIITSNDM
jgi:hypothetical protein